MYNRKTWRDRESQYPRRRLLTPIEEGDAALYNVSRAEGTVTEEGDAFSAENMNDLEGRIKAECDSIRNALVSQQNAINTVDNRVTTTNNTITALANSTNNALNSLSRDMQTTQSVVDEGFSIRAKCKFSSLTNVAITSGVGNAIMIDCFGVLSSRVWGVTLTTESGTDIFAAVIRDSRPRTASFDVICVTNPSFTGTISRLDVLIWGF